MAGRSRSGESVLLERKIIAGGKPASGFRRQVRLRLVAVFLGTLCVERLALIALRFAFGRRERDAPFGAKSLLVVRHAERGIAHPTQQFEERADFLFRLCAAVPFFQHVLRDQRFAVVVERGAQGGVERPAFEVDLRGPVGTAAALPVDAASSNAKDLVLAMMSRSPAKTAVGEKL